MLALFLGTSSIGVYAQRATETWKKTMPKTNTLIVDNINGSVKVKGTNGNTIELTAEKLITGFTKKDVAQGSKETVMKAFAKNDTTVFHVQNPYIRYRRNRNNSRGYGYQWDDWGQEKDYEFKFNITVSVPANTNLIIRTINQGNIRINNTKGDLVATNVNGSVYLENIQGKTKARTINGQLKASYTKVPDKNSSYYSLNGNIRVKYPKNLSAELRFKSFNGDFYTDYDVEYLPTKVTAKKTSRGKRKIYKVNEFTSVKVNKGGNIFTFETLNGNIYINRNK